MKKHQIILIVLLIISISSCKLGKNTTKHNVLPKPSWITSKPQNSIYYTGVSSASKKGLTPSEYIQSAQQKALVDLASSISINIESSSILSIIESNYHISENFSSEIMASTSQTLEDYELVETWEDDNYYWVYYRLSKSVYQTQKEKKKQQIIFEAKNKYNQANELMEKNSHYNAFQFYSDALITLKPYLGESTLTEINNQTADLGNAIFSSIADFVNTIKIEFAQQEVNVKKGLNISPDFFELRINSKNNVPMSNIPVRVNFTGAGLIKNSEVSDNNGKVFCSFRKITSAPNIETLSVSIDMIALSRTIKDPMIRNLIKNIPAAESKLRVRVEKPILKIITDEKSFGELKNEAKLKLTFEKTLNSEFIISNEQNYDFILNISTNVVKNGEEYGEPQVTMSYNFDLFDINSNLIYNKKSSNDYTANNYETASEKSYDDVSKSIERFIAREIISIINN